MELNGTGTSGVRTRAPFGRVDRKEVAAFAAERDSAITGATSSIRTGDVRVARRIGGGEGRVARDDELELHLGRD